MSTSMPFIKQHHEQPSTCPCCGYDEETLTDGPTSYGGEVFEFSTCPSCQAKWKSEWRLYATRHQTTNEVVLNESSPLSALLALQAASWLDDDPSDTDELAAAKQQARSTIDLAQRPNKGCRETSPPCVAQCRSSRQA